MNERESSGKSARDTNVNNPMEGNLKSREI